MAIEMRKPSPRGKWEKALDSSGFWLLPIALIVSNSLRDTLGFWLSLLVALGVMGGATFLLRLPAIAERTRRLADDAASGVVECAIRYPGALPGSLRAGWSSGFADVSDGTIKFQTTFDMAAKRKGSVTVFVDLQPMGVRPLSATRTPPLRRASQFMAISTDKGDIELASTSEGLKSIKTIFRRHGGP